MLASLSALAATLISIAHTRLSLLSTDLEEARTHLLFMLALTLTALLCLGMGLVLSTILLVAAFWDTHRLLTLGILATFYVASAMASGAVAVYRARTAPRLFAASLSELSKDRRQLPSGP